MMNRTPRIYAPHRHLADCAIALRYTAVHVAASSTPALAQPNPAHRADSGPLARTWLPPPDRPSSFASTNPPARTVHPHSATWEQPTPRECADPRRAPDSPPPPKLEPLEPILLRVLLTVLPLPASAPA